MSFFDEWKVEPVPRYRVEEYAKRNAKRAAAKAEKEKSK